MIIPNGTISIKRKAVGGIDPETGHPRRPISAQYETPIPCQIITTHYDATAIVQGEHVALSAYQVLLDEQPFDAEQIRLTLNNGKLLGDFSIIQIEPLQAVRQIRIFV